MATRLPTLKAIMAEKGCDIDAVRSIRARLEVEADRAHFRKTGRHALEVVSARDLARHPELAVQDTARPKFTEWKVGDGLKTTEARAFFIEAAIEENDLAFLAQSLAEVAKAAGNSRGAAFSRGLYADESAGWNIGLEREDGGRLVEVFVASADFMTDDGKPVVG